MSRQQVDEWGRFHCSEMAVLTSSRGDIVHMMYKLDEQDDMHADRLLQKSGSDGESDAHTSWAKLSAELWCKVSMGKR